MRFALSIRYRHPPTLELVRRLSAAETYDSFEVTAELPGVDEKDINVSLDDNQLGISGEKKG